MSSTPQKQLRTFNSAQEPDLPEGWTTAKLPDIANVTMGQSPPGSTYNEAGKGLPFFQGKADFGSRYPTARVWCTAPNKIARMGDILMSVRAPVGPTNVANQRCAIGRGLAAITPVGGIPSEFVLFALRLQEPELALSGTGSTFTAISRDDIDDIEINVPPLAEQKRAVAKIEELFACTKSSRARLSSAALILTRFRQSVVAAACSGRLTADWRKDDSELSELPSSWRWQPVEELLTKGGIFDGPFGSNLKTSDYTADGVRVIRMQNIGWLKFLGSKQTFVSEKKYESLIRHTVGAGDIIFSSFIEDQIRSCVLPALPTKAIAKADCFCIRPDPKLVDRHYLVLQLCSRESYEALRESIHGATRPRVNTTQVRAMSVRVCPPLEQQEIVRRVDALFTLADAIEKRLNSASKRADKLTQAILAKALRGELVPTEAELARREGREYEPASTLLEHIRTERTREAF